MLVILLEALAALALLLLLVWWTMFSGRPRGELPGPREDEPRAATAQAPDSQNPDHSGTGG